MAACVQGEPVRKRLFVVDCDGGVDDAQAILMIIARSDVDLVAITTAYGNTFVEQVGRNVRRLLRVAERTDIPIYSGANAPLVGLPHKNSFYYGADGFGDVRWDDAAEMESGCGTAEKEHAVSALLKLADAHPGEITLVCLGPLTNVALALKLDPLFGEKLHKCVIMGGNYKGRGNVDVCSEFNFHVDPESAFVVLQEMCCDIVVVTWELCLENFLTLSEYERLRDDGKGCRKSEFMRVIEGCILKKCCTNEKYVPCDEIAAAVALDASVVKDSSTVHASIELSGAYTRGQMVVDWADLQGKRKNVIVVLDIHKDPYMNLLRNATCN